jgi:hypothetical protein
VLEGSADSVVLERSVDSIVLEGSADSVVLEERIGSAVLEGTVDSVMLEGGVDSVLLSWGEYVNFGNSVAVLLLARLSTAALELDASIDALLWAAGDASSGAAVGDGGTMNEVVTTTSGAWVIRGWPSGRKKVMADTVCE